MPDTALTEAERTAVLAALGYPDNNPGRGHRYMVAHGRLTERLERLDALAVVVVRRQYGTIVEVEEGPIRAARCKRLGQFLGVTFRVVPTHPEVVTVSRDTAAA